MRAKDHLVESGNPFACPEIATGYDAWYTTTGRRADRLEKALLGWLLARFPRARTILEVGCGTGHFARWFSEQGWQAVGLDSSSPILAEALRLGSPSCVHGNWSIARLPGNISKSCGERRFGPFGRGHYRCRGAGLSDWQCRCGRTSEETQRCNENI